MLNMTEKAVSEIKRIRDLEKTPAEFLRIRVVGGGCSGMSYKLGFESGTQVESDKVFENDGVKLVVDAKSYLFLQGMTLDFSDGLNGKGFVFDNPNAKRTCGCGSSFSA